MDEVSMISEDVGRTMDAIGCNERQAEDILEEIERQKSIARFEEQVRVLKILKIKCNCRMRGLEVDIQNQTNKDYYTGALNEYDKLYRHLRELKYIQADIECAIKYLDKNEKAEYYELIGKKEEQDD